MEKKKVEAGFGVMLLRGDMVLMGKRHDDPEKASSMLRGEGTWSLTGGKLDFGETLEDGVYREVLEETGIRVNKNSLKLISVSNDMISEAHFVTLGFLCEDFEGEARVMEPDEVTEWKWFKLDELPSPIFFPAERILKNYKNKTIWSR